jgi:regulator of nonsense transcripts 3
LEFVAAYNGHMFRDKQGVQYQAIVEFAPFQRYIPFEKKNRIDQYMNTIEDDENYIQFLASMNDEPTEPQEEILQYEKETPLLLALRNEKLKRQKKAKKPKPTPVLVTNEPVKDTKKESIQGKKKKRPKKGEDKNNSGNLGKQDKNSLGKQQGQKSTKNDPQPKLVLQLSSKN